MSGGPNTLQFLYELIFTGVDAFDSAASAFRLVENEATDLLLDALKEARDGFDGARKVLPDKVVDPMLSVTDGLATFVRDANYIASFKWFTRILADVFLMILIALGTFLVLYLLG